MRLYGNEIREREIISQVLCNGCGRSIPLEGEEYFHGEKNWGYFSNADGERDSFDLCQECYDRLTAGFKIKLR